MTPKHEALIIILSHNRIDTVIDTLSSVINAAKGLADVMVSDNSSDKNVPIQIKKKFSDIPLVIQAFAPGPIAHLNAAIDLALSSSYQYLTIFHDDDLMLENFILCSLKDLKSNKQFVATACNAYIEKDGVIQGACYRSAEIFTCTSHIKFLERYLSMSGSGLAPFPGYMYRVSALEKNSFDILKGGRHADVSFLNELLKKGDISWRNDTAMVYRISAEGSYASEIITDRNSLFRYAKQFFLANKASLNILKAFRSYYIIRKKRLSGHSIFSLMLNMRYRKLLFHYLINLIKVRFLRMK